MKRKKIIRIVVLVLLTLFIFIFWLVYYNSQATGYSFKTEEITRGDVVNTVSCSGTLEAVGTVEVGTQVSAMIDHLYVDFNDRVKKDQILARLDTVLLKAQLIEAQANYQRAEAQMEEAKADHDRNLPLYQKGYISEAEYLPYKINLKTQEASLRSAEAAVIRAQRNLKYAVIRSPIDGTVIQRNVEEGQTVAASLQAPTLFIIAEDLSKMEIHALVDESDIGQIKEGQRAVFEVQSYPDRKFEGTVRQVRLQPEVVQNVVNYTVIVNAYNEEKLLLPGMTATIDFYVEEKRNVLLIPNTALHFQPSDEMMRGIIERRQKNYKSPPDSTRRNRFQMQPGSGDLQDTPGPPPDMAMVWYINNDGHPDSTPVRTGSTDGKVTEIVWSRDLEEGMRVITGLLNQTNDNQENKSPAKNRRMGPGPPPLFR
jgi:HlyD family secretion protein